MSKIEDKVAKMLIERSKIGESKYGTTMERRDLNLLEWLQHLQEELLDAAVYVEKLKEVSREDYEDLLIEIFGKEDEVMYDWDEEELDKRMRVVGQNGNTGEHYDTANYLYSKTDIQKSQQDNTYHPNMKFNYESTKKDN